ncbi:hypothetical protein CHUAL_001669 [Chamberlinius hualienensis]
MEADCSVCHTIARYYHSFKTTKVYFTSTHITNQKRICTVIINGDDRRTLSCALASFPISTYEIGENTNNRSFTVALNNSSRNVIHSVRKYSIKKSIIVDKITAYKVDFNFNGFIIK